MLNGDVDVDEEGSIGFSTLIHLSSDIIFLAKWLSRVVNSGAMLYVRVS